MSTELRFVKREGVWMLSTYARLIQGLSLSQKSEHPFTYCKEHVIPAMRENGREPDDPDAFCAWWKAEHGS